MRVGPIIEFEFFESIFKDAFDSDTAAFSKALNITEERVQLIISGQEEPSETENQNLRKIAGISDEDWIYWLKPEGNIYLMAAKRKLFDMMPWKELSKA